MKAAALRGALSDRARDGRVHVVDRPRRRRDARRPRPRSRRSRAITERQHVLVVARARATSSPGRRCATSPSVHLLAPDQLNTYDVLVSDDVVFTQAALDAFLAGPRPARPPRPIAERAEAEEAQQ